MAPGNAIPAAFVIDDGIATYGRWNGLAPLARVWKCTSCGHSFVPPSGTILHTTLSAYQRAAAIATPTSRYCTTDDHLRYATRGKCGKCGREFALHLNPANP